MNKKTTPWRFPTDLGSLEQEMARVFEETIGRGIRGPRVPGMFRWSPKWLREWTRIPFVDVYEEGDDLVVKAEVPGMSREEIDLTVAAETLTIRGEKKKEETIAEEDYYFSERSEGSISRSVELPVAVQADKVSASLKNGVLEIRLPKVEASKRKEIKVKVV